MTPILASGVNDSSGNGLYLAALLVGGLVLIVAVDGGDQQSSFSSLLPGETISIDR